VFCIFTLPAVLCIFNLAEFQMRIPPLSHEESQLYKQIFVQRGGAGRIGRKWGTGASARNGAMNFRDKETDLFALNKF